MPSFEDFRASVGSMFGLNSGTTLTLAEAKPGSGRDSFSLIFRGEAGRLDQRTHALTHDDLGALDIFLVPIGREDDVFLYEAVFN